MENFNRLKYAKGFSIKLKQCFQLHLKKNEEFEDLLIEGLFRKSSVIFNSNIK